IARVALGRPEAELYLRLALLGLVPLAASGFVAAVLQSTRRFGRLAALQGGTACTYLAGVAALAATDHLDLASLLLLGVRNPLFGFVAGLRLLPPGFVSLSEVGAARRVWPELAAFGKWLWASAVPSLLASQLDLILLGHLAPAGALGVYALAFNLSLKMDVV